MDEIVIQNKNYRHLRKEAFILLKLSIWLNIYSTLLMLFMLFFSKNGFDFRSFVIIWLLCLGGFFLMYLSSLPFAEISYCKLDANFICIKPISSFFDKKIPLTKIKGLGIHHYSDYTSIGIDYEKKKNKIDFISFRAENYELIKNWVLQNKIPLSVTHSRDNSLTTFIDILPHIWWFRKEYMIQRSQDLPITKSELLNLYNPQFSIQFIGTSEDYFTNDDSVVDTFSLTLPNNSKEAIDLYLEEGYILATTHQSKFKKALQELALQLNAKIS
jgi:hypothetical protein